MSSVDDIAPEELVDCLGQKYAFTILRALSEGPKSAAEIIEEHDVPRTTFYRRVDELVEMDLVREEGQIDLSGAHSTRYECNVDGIEIRLDGDEVSIQVDRRAEPVERWGAAWHQIRKRSE